MYDLLTEYKLVHEQYQRIPARMVKLRGHVGIRLVLLKYELIHPKSVNY